LGAKNGERMNVKESRGLHIRTTRRTVSALQRLLRLALFTLLLIMAPQGTALAAPSMDYVALGDSLATGFGAFRGYVPRYETYAETDTGATVRLTNLGRNGWTSSQLLYALRNDATFRQAVRGAEIVTWDIGGNDMRAARTSYKNETCGGTYNQRCLREAVAKLNANWDAITVKILSLRSTPDRVATKRTIIRTMDLYNPYVRTDKAADTGPYDGPDGVQKSDSEIFKGYLEQVNDHIAATSSANEVPYAKVYLAFNGPSGDEDPAAKGYLSFDGLHPNDTGHRVIAGKLRLLGYAPLR
jgi:lysophospholipase L1-like esterase